MAKNNGKNKVGDVRVDCPKCGGEAFENESSDWICQSQNKCDLSGYHHCPSCMKLYNDAGAFCNECAQD